MVRAEALRLREAGAIMEDISIPEHIAAFGIILSSIIDGTLSAFADQGISGPNPKGHFPLAAIEFYQKARHERSNENPVTVWTILMFALAMGRR